MRKSKIKNFVFYFAILIYGFWSLSFIAGCVREKPSKSAKDYELGLLYHKSREFKKAKESLKSAIALNSKDPRIHNLLGLVYEREGLFEDAKKSFQEALRLNKKFEEARTNLLSIEAAKEEYNFYRCVLDFIYVLSKEYSNGNNSFLRGLSESKAVKNEYGNVTRYDVSLDVYLAKEYFTKCSKLLEKTAERTSISNKSLLDIIDRLSQAIQQREESIDLQVEGYTMNGGYAGEFEKAEAKVKIADTYYVDSAKKLEGLMSDRPDLFDKKDLANIRHLIDYYSQEKVNRIELFND